MSCNISAWTYCSKLVSTDLCSLHHEPSLTSVCASSRNSGIVGVTPAGAGGAAVGGGGLAHGAASRRPAGGQRQQRGVHAGVPHGTLSEGRQEALRES